MNLLMIAPLVDSRGNTRYHIGAQVDVSGLVRDCTDLHGLQNMLLKLEGSKDVMEEDKDEFQELCEMFGDCELNAVRKFGGHMHKGHLESTIEAANGLHRPRLLLKEPSPELGMKNNAPSSGSFGNLEGIYKHVSNRLPLKWNCWAISTDVSLNFSICLSDLSHLSEFSLHLLPSGFLASSNHLFLIVSEAPRVFAMSWRLLFPRAVA